MKKLFLSLVAVFTAMGLYAEDIPEQKQAFMKTPDGKFEPTQFQKNIWEASDRLDAGKASQADKELVKSVSDEIMNKVHQNTIYEFTINVDSPSFKYLYALSAMTTNISAAVIDQYVASHCSTDLTKASVEDLQKGANSILVGLKDKTLEYVDHNATASKEDYTKFVHAARAFNCGDNDALKKYLQKDNEFEGTFLTGLVKEDMGDKSVFMSYENEAGNECTVIGHTSPTIPSLGGQFARVEIKLEKETCKSGEAFMIKGYIARPGGSMIFSNITPGDKVKIVKTK